MTNNKTLDAVLSANGTVSASIVECKNGQFEIKDRDGIARFVTSSWTAAQSALLYRATKDRPRAKLRERFDA